MQGLTRHCQELKMCICPIQGTIQGAIKVSQVCLGSLLAYFVAKAEPKILRLVTGFRIILTDLKDKIFINFHYVTLMWLHCTFISFYQKFIARTVHFRTGRLTRNCFHRFLCLIGSTASYKTNADQDTFCGRDTDWWLPAWAKSPSNKQNGLYLTTSQSQSKV